MSQAEDLLNSLSENDISTKTEPHIIVGSNRVITVPSELKRIAVQYDHNIETVTFDCPRYWDDHDMSTMKVYINYTRADNEPGCYIADDVAVDETDTSIMHFSWTISRHVTEAVGPLTILICIKMVDKDGNEVNHWNSERNTDMTISQGMECGDIIVNKYPDVITYLLEDMGNLADLTTEDKSSLVAAINEAAASGGSKDAVTYTPQTLTEEQKSQARTNIGALDENIETTPVDIGVGLGSTVYYVQSGWLKPCPDNTDKELRLQYRRVFEFIGSQYLQPSSQDMLLQAKSAYALYQKGLASESIKVTYNPLAAEQVYVKWNLSTRNNKHYFYYAQVSTAYQYTCTYCVEDDALASEFYERPVYRTVNGVGEQDSVSQFRMRTNPTEDMHIATKQYVDTAKTEAQQLGLTAATPGKTIKVKTVQDGKPTEWEAVDIYEKPTSGIPKSDLAQSVQTSLGKADTAISYDSQTLMEAQQKQARTNIGAGQPLFVVNVTTTLSEQGDEVYTADKTAAEIETAYQEGCEIVCRMSVPIIGMGLVPVQLPLASRRGRQIFMFAINQTMWTDKSSRIVSYLVTIADDGVNVGQNNTEIYIKPASGIPKTDLADDVQTSLDKADTAISLGLTAATPGQIIKVKTVQDGKPTEWEAVDMDAGKFPKFQKLLTHTITEDELAASPIAFMWGTAQIPNLNDFNVFVLTIVRPDGAKIEFSKWVKLKINSTLLGNICGSVNAASPTYAITANRLFGAWISGNYYDARNVGVPVLVPPGSSSTFQSNLPDSEPVTSIGFTSYVADYGLTAGIVVEIWGAK